ncbi:hypothetical protein Acr_23g0008920 [Actinidia rufa]|uniref:Uncharacterized protein n=1 Tax=Actinidia rufa TaxID=165716 RepID=A0A7J0GNV7_9ERIC|nr:hypothetical protein Acr_23g0008920 [Actinidia rufa]
MLETPSEFLAKTRPKTTSLPPRASTVPPTIDKMAYKSSTIVAPIPEKKAARTPVEIGTRGTFGSLVVKEIEYFSQLELGCQDKSEKPRCQFPKTASTSAHSRPQKLGSLLKTPKRKKKGGSKFIPSMCSMVEVAESTRPNMTISGFNYRNLKADVKKMQA